MDSAEMPGAAAVPESEENVWWRENSDKLTDAEQQALSPSRLRTRDQGDVQEMNEEATSPIAASSPPSQPMAMCTITSPKGSPGRSICHDASPPRPQHAAAGTPAAGMKRPLEAAGKSKARAVPSSPAASTPLSRAFVQQRCEASPLPAAGASRAAGMSRAPRELAFDQVPVAALQEVSPVAVPVPVLAYPPTMMDDSDELYLYPSQASTADSAPLYDVDVPPQQDESQLSAYWQNDGVFEDADALVAVHMTHKQEGLAGPGAKRTDEPVTEALQEVPPVAVPVPVPVAATSHASKHVVDVGSVLPFPLRFALEAAGAKPTELSPSVINSLARAFTEGSWRAVSALAASDKLLPRTALNKLLAVHAPPKGSDRTLGYSAIMDLDDMMLGSSEGEASVGASVGVSGGVTLVGPRPMPTTRLQHVVGSEMLLKVNLVSSSVRSHDAFEKRSRDLEMAHKLHQFFNAPIVVAGRTYRFVLYKDAGKLDEQIWFLAVDGPAADLGVHSTGWWSVQAAREGLGVDLRTCKSVAKYAARGELALSGTVSVLESCTFRVIRDLRDMQCQSWGALHRALRQLGLYDAADASSRSIIFIVEISDKHGVEPDGLSPALDANGDKHIMTDGAGMISVDLVEELIMWELDRRPLPDSRKWREAPLVMQIRLWYDALAKGTLTTSACLPKRTIVVRRSMVKVEGASGNLESRGSLEINGAQGKPNEAASSQFLVPLLEARGGVKMVEALLHLQSEAAKEYQELFALVMSEDELKDEDAMELDRTLALDHVEIDGPYMGPSPADMLIAGMDTRDPVLRQKLAAKLKSHLKGIARGRFSLPDSFSLMAIPDPSDTLEEGEVAVYLQGSVWVEDRILVYKAPGCHPGDIRCVKAVRPVRALEDHFQFGKGTRGLTALVLSTKGRRSLADQITGSDMDGDIFSVIKTKCILDQWPETPLAPWEVRRAEPQSAEPDVHPDVVVQAIPPAAPAATLSAAPAPPRRLETLSEADLHRELINNFRRCREGQEIMRDVATKWKAWADLQGAQSDQCIELSYLYMAACDAGKADTVLKIPPHLDRCLPYHLQKNADVHARKSLTSQSALARMWLAVSSNSILSTLASSPLESCPKPSLDPELQLKDWSQMSPDEQNLFTHWQSVWPNEWKAYKDQVKNLPRGDRGDDEWNWKKRAAFAAIVSKHRAMLLQGEDPAVAISDALFLRASALHVAVYSNAASFHTSNYFTCGLCKRCMEQTTRKQRPWPNLNFVWLVAGDILLQLKVRNRHAKLHSGRAPYAVDMGRLNARQRRRRPTSGTVAMVLDVDIDEMLADGSFLE